MKIKKPYLMARSLIKSSHRNIQKLFILSFLLINFDYLSNSKNTKHVSDIAAAYNSKIIQPIDQEEEWKIEAREMVENQIIRRGVKDKRVLKVMENTPRHLFVPSDYRKRAYDDTPLPIGHGQTISQPYIVAWMTELLELEGGESVLEIGAGSGYQAAVLSPLVKHVYTLEIVKELADSSKARLERLGYENVLVKWGDGYKGWPEYAPFDAIIITAAPEKTPKELIDQLKPGGIMVLPVGDLMQQLKVIRKLADGSIKEQDEGWVRFVPMIHSKENIKEKP